MEKAFDMDKIVENEAKRVVHEFDQIKYERANEEKMKKLREYDHELVEMKIEVVKMCWKELDSYWDLSYKEILDWMNHAELGYPDERPKLADILLCNIKKDNRLKYDDETGKVTMSDYARKCWLDENDQRGYWQI